MNNGENYTFKVFRSFMWGLLVAASTILMLTFLATLVMNFSTAIDAYFPIIKIIITIIGLFLGGLMTGHILQKNGLLNGIILGIIFLGFMVLMTFLEGESVDTNILIIKGAYSLIPAALGSLTGVLLMKNVEK